MNKEVYLDFLLTADFKEHYGYSYAELIKFLNYYQIYYRKVYENNQWVKHELEHRDKILAELNDRIYSLEQKIEFQDQQITFFKKCITRKLSLWERLSGKIIL